MAFIRRSLTSETDIFLGHSVNDYELINLKICRLRQKCDPVEKQQCLTVFKTDCTTVPQAKMKIEFLDMEK